jgi:hypothetical protein
VALNTITLTPDITEIQKEKQKIEIITRQIISKLPLYDRVLID